MMNWIDKKKTLLIVLFIFVIGCSITWNSLENPFIFDDLNKVVHNVDLKEPLSSVNDLFQRLIYSYQFSEEISGNRVKISMARNDPSRPLIYLIYTFIYQFDGSSPFCFHLLNSIIHAFNGILIFLISRNIFSFLNNKKDWKKSLSVSLFFVLAPIQMGTVVYIYGLSDLLATFLSLNCMLFFTYSSNNLTLNRVLKVFSYFFFVLALMSKQSALVIPILISLFNFILFKKRNKKDKKLTFYNYIPFLIIGIIYLIFRFLYFGELGDLEAQNRTHERWEYFFTQPLILFRYLFLTIFPFGLSIDHYVRPETYSFLHKSLAILCLTLIILLILKKCFNLNASSTKRLIFFCTIFYIINLIPTSSVIPTVDIMVERRVYFANFGIFILIVFFYNLFKYSNVFIFLHLFIFSFISFERNLIFSDEEKVWEDVLLQYPKNPRAGIHAANIYMNRSEFEKAKKLYESIIYYFPQDPYAYNNLGTLYAQDKFIHYNLDQAIKLFKQSLVLNPLFFESWYGLAVCYDKLNHKEEAKKAYLRTIEIQPSHAFSHLNLALIYLKEKNKDLAIYEFKLALNYNPQLWIARENLIYLTQ